MKRITLKTKDKNGISYQDKIEFMVSQFKPTKKNKKLPYWWDKNWSAEDNLYWLLEVMSDYRLLSKEGERLYAMFLRKIYK